MTKTQKKYIQRLIDHFENLSEEDYKQFLYRSADNRDCGCLIFHSEQVLPSGFKKLTDYFSFHTAIEKYLGIKNDSDGELFFASRVFPKEKQPKIADAIAMLKHLKKTGKVNWRVAPNYPKGEKTNGKTKYKSTSKRESSSR